MAQADSIRRSRLISALTEPSQLIQNGSDSCQSHNPFSPGSCLPVNATPELLASNSHPAASIQASAETPEICAARKLLRY
jgi:hypothetical protein